MIGVKVQLVVLFYLFVLFSSGCISGSAILHDDVGATPAERALKIVQQLTLDEKISLVHGWKGTHQGNTPALPRLMIPPLHLEDGPQGPGSDGVKLATCWPAPLAVVSSFDASLMEQMSVAIAEEEKAKGVSIVLGPMVNIARIPQGGRNFESFGEDPFLAGEMAAAAVNGIQSTGLMACVKHWANNNQEHNRGQVSANVDERTQHEIYYPAFKKAVDSGVGSVMCGYNRINNTYACENDHTLTVALKQEMGFQGFVVSDWGGTHSTIAAANNGLDMQMPDDTYFGAALLKAVNSGQVPLSRLDDMLIRTLTSVISVGIFDNPPTGNVDANVTSEAHNRLSQQLSASGTVLLKNSPPLLPLNPKINKIALIGDDANNHPIVAPPSVPPPYIVTALQGISQRAGPGVSISYIPSGQLDNAINAAKAADVAIIFVAELSNEGEDRPNLSLSADQNQLVQAVATAQPNTVVVVHSTGAVLMPWISSVPSVLAAFLPGQEGGHAIASILFGDVNPSAKLPITFPISDSQVPASTPEQYPGVNDETVYSEKLLVGYRWYDATEAVPLFPFGHGLSYTNFLYSPITIDATNLIINGNISNIGLIEGSEVVQLYLNFPAFAGEPPQVLRGFQKINLLPGEIKPYNFTLGVSDLSIWDISASSWTPVRGPYLVLIGSSSRDIRQKVAFSY